MRQDRPPRMEGRIRPAITWQWAEGACTYMAGRMADSVVEVLNEHGVMKEKIGIDNLDMPAYEAFQKAGLAIVNGWLAVSRARTVKTRDEAEPLKQASSIGDAAMWKIKYEWLKPGVREREIEAKVHEFMLERGCEIIYDIIVASGGNTIRTAGGPPRSSRRGASAIVDHRHHPPHHRLPARLSAAARMAPR